MITYKVKSAKKVAVYLEGKKVGTIHKSPDGYQYWALDKYGGETFPTLKECKDSLEGDDD